MIGIPLSFSTAILQAAPFAVRRANSTEREQNTEVLLGPRHSSEANEDVGARVPGMGMNKSGKQTYKQ